MAETIDRPDSVLHDLLYAAKLTRDRLRSVMKVAGLHRGQGYVLMVVAHNEGIMQCDLADAVHVRPATLSATVRRMEDNGIVERRSDPHDERVSRVYLTEKGREIATEARAFARNISQDIEGCLQPAEVMLLRRMLQDIQARFEHHPPA